MPPKGALLPPCSLGFVVEHYGGYRLHLSAMPELGTNSCTHGIRRPTEAEANEDWAKARTCASRKDMLEFVRGLNEANASGVTGGAHPAGGPSSAPTVRRRISSKRRAPSLMDRPSRKGKRKSNTVLLRRRCVVAPQRVTSAPVRAPVLADIVDYFAIKASQSAAETEQENPKAHDGAAIPKMNNDMIHDGAVVPGDVVAAAQRVCFNGATEDRAHARKLQDKMQHQLTRLRAFVRSHHVQINLAKTEPQRDLALERCAKRLSEEVERLAWEDE